MTTATTATTAGLTLEESVPLGYALVSRIAQECGVRALGIKGPVLTLQGLRSPRTTVDIDFLVDPVGLNRLESALSHVGWRNERFYDYASVLPVHSVNLEHASWPCELDLHHWFPGFLGEPREVFDVLWERRTSMSLASSPVTVLDPLAHAALAAANCLRDSADAERTRQLQRLVDVVTGWPESELTELSDVIHRTGGQHTLAPFLRRLGIAESAASLTTFVDPDLWRVSAAIGSKPLVPWLVHLKRTPLRRRPAVAMRAVWMGDQELRAGQRAGGSGGWRAMSSRVRRLRRAVVGLPSAVRELRSLRQS